MTDPASTTGLAVTGLRKRFGAVRALDGCDLRLEPGELVGFLGPNGAGKSTTMRSIMGLITVDAGTVTWRSTGIDEAPRRRFGYMPQERGLYLRMRVLEQVEYFGRLAGLDPSTATERAMVLLERVGLDGRVDDEVQELSVGNQQRVQLAVALVHEPELLILDEPFAGLDPIAIDVLRTIITEQTDRGVAVLFSSHQLDLVQELCRDIVIIDAGRTIAHGSVGDIRARSQARLLRVAWEQSENGSELSSSVDDWRPTGPDGSPAERTVDPAGRVAFRLPADADPAVLMAEASAVGPVTSFRFEPPSLDDVFTEMVGHSARGAEPNPAGAAG